MKRNPNLSDAPVMGLAEQEARARIESVKATLDHDVAWRAARGLWIDYRQLDRLLDSAEAWLRLDRWRESSALAVTRARCRRRWHDRRSDHHSHGDDVMALTTCARRELMRRGWALNERGDFVPPEGADEVDVLDCEALRRADEAILAYLRESGDLLEIEAEADGEGASQT